jgi:hypothetical protein
MGASMRWTLSKAFSIISLVRTMWRVASTTSSWISWDRSERPMGSLTTHWTRFSL